MLHLQLRPEFTGDRLKGTTIDFSSDKATSALKVPADDFLAITYPSVDLLKVLEHTQPGRSHPVVLLGSRGQGKSHLMAALFHALQHPDKAGAWLNDWSQRLARPELTSIKFRSDMHVIAESLHQQRYKALWDILFERHPKGEYIKGKWESKGAAKSNVPDADLLLEMFTAQPSALLLDEFQTWYDGLTNSSQFRWKDWAFNFIQLLSELAEAHPEKLVLVTSIRDNQSQAYQQLHRIQPVVVDFSGAHAKQDRQRLLLYRIFQNRLNIPASDIDSLVSHHVSEHLRLDSVPPAQHETRRAEFMQCWPYSPMLLKLLEDQVLVATQAQQTRDLVRILVDLFKTRGEVSPVLTAGDFLITPKASVIPALLSSVSNPLHRNLLDKAIRNLSAVREAVVTPDKTIPHAEEIISALWLRSLSVERVNGAEPDELQQDITRDAHAPIDDNAFAAEMALIRENSFNIHPLGNRLVFREEENAEGKLLAHARNDNLFSGADARHAKQDIEQLAKEVAYAIAGSEEVSRNYRVIVLRKLWCTKPWDELPETERPDRWDGRQPVMLVLPEFPDNQDTTLGQWLKDHLPVRRNTVRFLLPPKGTENVFFTRELLIFARAIFLANLWKETDPSFSSLFTTYRRDQLQPRLKTLFESFAVLDIWNFALSQECKFIVEKHGATGDKIPQAVQRKLETELFVQEDFEEDVLAHADSGASISKLLADLQEPRIGGKHCIPWLGETIAKEKLLRVCAAGKIALNLRGMELAQANPGESEEACWLRIRGKLGTGKDLETTIILKPGAIPGSGGTTPPVPPPPVTPAPGPGPIQPGGTPAPDPSTPTGTPQPTGPIVQEPKKTALGCAPKSPLNLLGELETWGVQPASNLSNINLNIQTLSGAQLTELLNKLPPHIKYALNVEKEMP